MCQDSFLEGWPGQETATVALLGLAQALGFTHGTFRRRRPWSEHLSGSLDPRTDVKGAEECGSTAELDSLWERGAGWAGKRTSISLEPLRGGLSGVRAEPHAPGVCVHSPETLCRAGVQFLGVSWLVHSFQH